MKLTPQNYRSDLPFIEVFYKLDSNNELVIDKIPDAGIDFEFVYRAEDDRNFTAGRKKGTYFNCKALTESSIEVHIPLSRKPLGTGELLHELRLYTPNEDFPENIQQIRIPASTGYILHKGASAAFTAACASSAIAAAVLSGQSAYAIARDKYGYEGTEEEYVKAPVLAVAALERLKTVIEEAETETQNAKDAADATNEVLEKLTKLISSSGNIINISEIAPPDDGYYTLETAIEVVDPIKRKPGRWITFEAAAGKWLTYRYNGTTAEEKDWTTPGNWESLEFPALKEGDNIVITRNEDGSYTIVAKNTPVVDNLDSDSKSAAASARLAKVLNGKIVDLDENVPDGFIIDEDGNLCLTHSGRVIGDNVKLPEGGSGGSWVLMKMAALTPLLTSTVAGATVRIGYNFSSVYQNDGSETGDGTAIYTINSQKVATAIIRQGDVYFDVTKWLSAGTNTVKVTVKDATGQSRSMSFTVEVISLSISDSYDDAQVNTGAITYRYTPVGAINKTIHFVLDGEEIGTKETAESNRLQSFVVPAQPHGAARLEVYMTAMVNDTEVRSNTLAHDLISIREGNIAVIIASSFNRTTAQQYDKLPIPFVVYDPAASTSQLQIYANDSLVSEQTVDRTLQTWTYRIPTAGPLSLRLVAGGVEKHLPELTVSEAPLVVEAETADLELYLTAQNRSNNDDNREAWQYGAIAAALSGFNWTTNGWITDDAGSTCLRVNGGAQAVVPLKLFETDIRGIGKTVEIEFVVRDVYNYDTPVISCWAADRGIRITAQSARIKSEQSDIETKFKDQERIRLAFVVEKRTDNRLLSIYVNGIKSQTFQYPETDNFMQAAPVGITIGGPDATVDIYTIRSYNNNLNRYQLLNNYIADIDDYDRKVAASGDNDIYDDYGNVSFAKVNERIDCLVFEGDLPQYKGDKKTNTVYLYSSVDPALNWSATVKNNVQGTSSQYYPRKNYKFEFIDGLEYMESGAHADAYQVTDEVLPASAFCIKTDFAESSGTYNTGVANMADWMLKEMGILTEAQKENPKVRTTVAGRPCVLFHKATADSQPIFVGKVNFNTDKSAEQTFGFAPGDESWEFLTNTTDMALFKSADFAKWQETIEARYPDGGADTANVKAVFDWVVSCKDNPEKFKAECGQYFDQQMLVFYALLTLTLGMTDQRAKNMFLTRYRGKLWLFILYDNDTLLPINNEGLIALLYNVETRDIVNGANIWNGADSELWILVETALADEMREMYYTLRQRNVLSYDRLIDYLYTRQAGRWCEAIYNEDGYYKYEQPLIEGYLDYSQSHENPQIVKTGAYLYALQGSREMYGKWIWKNRLLYMDSKFLAGSILGDTAVFRTYTPTEWAGVAPCADITLTAFNAMYFNVKWGSVTKSQRVGFNETFKMLAPEGMQFNDTETIIYGASLIASLGDLAPLYPGTVDVSKMVKLKELIIGSGAEGYQNRNLRSLSIGENRMLRKLDVRNCPEYSEPIAVQNCVNIEEIYAQGTTTTAVNLPEGGSLAKLYLPESITSLVLKNQPKLQDAFFEIAGVENLSTIICENTPGINIFPIIDRCLTQQKTVLTRVRTININAYGANLDSLYKLIQIGGLDEKGNNIPQAVVTGKFHATTATEDKLAKIRAAFPELTITYTNLKPATVTTFVFGSSQSKAITNAVFECNQEFTKVSETTYKVSAEDYTPLSISFKCDNHKDFTAEYLVEGTRTQNYSVAYIPLRTIRIQVSGQSIYPAGASVVIGEKVYISDNNGYVYIRSGDAVSGTVSATGYAGNTFSYSEITSDASHTVVVYAAVDVKFIVKNDLEQLVQNAVVTCNGISKTTNQYGECVLQIIRGTHDYTVTHPNYFEYNGSIVVETSSTSTNISLKFNYATVVPAENGNIQMMLSGTIGKINITSTTMDYTIDWGDGTTTAAERTGSQSYSHTYIDNAQHYVEIQSCIDVTYANGDASCLIAYWSLGNSKVAGLSFYNYTKLNYLGNVFKNDLSRSSASNLFSGCRNLTSVDLSPLAGWVNVTKVDYLFAYCSSLTSVDLTPLAGWVNVTSAVSLLSGCSGLTTVDLSPLAGWVNVTNVNYLFADCSSLTSVDLTPLAGWVNVTSASNLLFRCSGLTAADLTPLAEWVNVTSAVALLSGCSGLTSVDLTPLAGWVNITSASSMLYGCSGLTSVDLTPLAGWVNVTDAGGLLSGCSGLTAVDLTPLAGWVNVTNAASLLAECKGLTSVDLAPLSGWTDVINASTLFYKCSGLTLIDLRPLAGWVNVTKASYLFFGCGGLTSVDLTPLAGWVNVTDASYLFVSCSGLTSVDLAPLTRWVNVTNTHALFSGCSGLTSLNLTPLEGWVNVTNAGNLIASCSGLTSLDLTPLAGWNEMISNTGLVNWCTRLLSITILATIPFTLSSGALNETKNCPIYVPDEAVDAYKTATNWAAYADRIKPISEKPEA